jgi:hypothetical protein
LIEKKKKIQEKKAALIEQKQKEMTERGIKTDAEIEEW